MSEKWYVYLYTDVDGSPRYVGIGKTPWRWKAHLREKTNPRLWNKIKKLKASGITMPHAKILEDVTKEEAAQEEIRLIALYGRAGIDPSGILFNRTLGGDGTRGFSRKQPSEERAKRKAKSEAYWQTPEGLARKPEMSKAAKAQMSTPEAKAKTALMGSARKGKPGKPQSIEWKTMMGPIVAESNKRRVYTDQDRAHRRRAALLSVESRRRKKASLNDSSGGDSIPSR